MSKQRGCTTHGFAAWWIKPSGKGKCNLCSAEYDRRRYQARREQHCLTSRLNWHKNGGAERRAKARGEARAAEWARRNAQAPRSPIEPDQSTARTLDLWALAYGHTGDLTAWERAELLARLRGQP